jgi:arylsulfatase
MRDESVHTPLLKVLVLLLIVLSVVQPAHADSDPVRPNILVFLVDDMGFSDVGAYGGEIRTPNIDRLASGGLRFTQFYNSGRCWPSRASLLTGYYAQSVGRDVASGPVANRDKKKGLADRPAWAQLLPVYLKPFGYRSYHVGKWHLDGTPLQSGFDRSYLNMNELGYFRAVNQQLDEVDLPDIDVDGTFYSTVSTVDYSIRFLEEHREKYPDQPFFAYIAFNSPHFPVQALPQDIAVYKDRYREGWDVIREERLGRLREMGIVNSGLPPLDPGIVPRKNLAESELREKVDRLEVAHAVPWQSLTPGEREFQAEKMAVHAAMVHRIDLEVGRVMRQLEKMGVFEDTLIFFLSDNGASAEQIVRRSLHRQGADVGSPDSYLCIGPGWSSAANTPFRLHKSWVHEGGIATPLIVHWPAAIEDGGDLRTSPAHVIDLLPTVREVLGDGSRPGSGAPLLPGVSLVPEFRRDGALEREFLWWDHDGNRAIRVGDWKLVSLRGSAWELYDLGRDRAESENLADRHPDRVKALASAWSARAAEIGALASRDH